MFHFVYIFDDPANSLMAMGAVGGQAGPFATESHEREL
jgi:hypothetical protein